MKMLSSNKFPIKPLFPFTVNQKVSWWNTEKNKDPKIEYKIIKNKFSIIVKNFFSLKINIPVKNIEKGIKIDINPMDW